MPPSRRARYRRSPFLVSYWEGSQLVLLNYVTRRRARANSLAISVLDLLSAPAAIDEITRALARFSPDSVKKAIAELQELTFIQPVTAAADKFARSMESWSEWGKEAQVFHYATKDVHFVKNDRELAKLEHKLLKAEAQPAFCKRYSSRTRIRLPRAELVSRASLSDVLIARRTHRRFTRKALSLSELASLLKLTWGVSGYTKAGAIGEVPLKTSPSGGARHPIEVYVAAYRVAGLKPGLYHYAADLHRLELLREGDFSARAATYCGNQRWVRGAAAMFFMTAVFARTRWRYKFSRALRVIYIEAGHLCQTFCLTATALGLGPFCTAALADSKIEADLGIDGVSESILYVAGVGKVAKSPLSV